MFSKLVNFICKFILSLYVKDMKADSSRTIYFNGCFQKQKKKTVSVFSVNDEVVTAKTNPPVLTSTLLNMY